MGAALRRTDQGRLAPRDRIWSRAGVDFAPSTPNGQARTPTCADGHPGPSLAVSAHSLTDGLDQFFAGAGSFRIHRAWIAGKLAPRPRARHGVPSRRFSRQRQEVIPAASRPPRLAPPLARRLPRSLPVRGRGRSIEARSIPPDRGIRRIGGRYVRDSHDGTPAFPLASPGRFRGWSPGTAKKMNRGVRATFVRRSTSHDTSEVKVHVDSNDASRT
jgi:hypothetical protein